jgi:hypothetical protein
MAFLDLMTAAVGGGALVKILDYAVSEYRRRSELKRSVRHAVDRHMDPILKSGDDLVGKLRSLALEDFKACGRFSKFCPEDFTNYVSLGSVIYLFAHFWGRLAILRREGLYVELGKTQAGAKLKIFIDELETRGVRVVDRAWQRGIGEAITRSQGDNYTCLTFHGFIRENAEDERFRQWFYPLVDVLKNTNKTQIRQKVLLYGVVIHAMLDTLDPKHHVVADRPSYPNKLSNKTRRVLRYKVFKEYLPFVKGIEKYLDQK